MRKRILPSSGKAKVTFKTKSTPVKVIVGFLALPVNETASSRQNSAKTSLLAQ